MGLRTDCGKPESYPNPRVRRARNIQGSTRALIGLPKLFIGGKVSAANLAPQPTVNNFAAAAKMTCEKLKFHPKEGGHAWPGRRITRPNARRLTRDFRSGPSALTQRNAQEPFARKVSLRRRTTIRFSIRPGLRAHKQIE